MKATNANDAFGLVFVDELVRAGIRTACLSPGSRSTPVARALAENPDIDLVVAHDERSSGFVALGMARATGLPIPVLSTSGTAAANFLPAIVEADLSGVPLIVITADRPGELRATGANQSIDQVKLYGDSVRWFCEVGVPEAIDSSNAYWRSLAARAVGVARARPPGPVHLNCAFREPLVRTDETYPFPLEGRAAGEPWTRVERGTASLDEDGLERVAQKLSAARSGVVVAGPDVDDPDAVPQVAEALGWPLLADPLSNARRGPNALSTYDALLRVPGFAEHHEPDVVLRFGRLGISKALMAHLRGAPEQILIDPHARPLDPDRSLHEIVAADVRTTVDALLKVVNPPRDGSWLASWHEPDEAARRAIDAVLDRAGLSEPRTARDLVASIPDGSALFVGASMPFRDVEWFSGPRAGVRFFGNRGANGIDGSISTPVGIAAVSGTPTYALIGDVSLLHDQNGLLTSATERTDLTIVCVNNDGGGIFSFLPQADDPEHFERLFGTPHGRDLSLVARLHGCDYLPIGSPEELVDAVVSSTGRTRIVEVRTERNANVRLHRELMDAVRDVSA